MSTFWTGAAPAFEHFRSEDKLFTFRSVVPVSLETGAETAAIFLLAYGPQLLGRWLGPLWAVSSAPLLPAFIFGTALGVAAQFNSSSILYGMAKHGPFARGMLAEAVAGVMLLLWVLPRYGLLGAAWVMAALMALMVLCSTDFFGDHPKGSRAKARNEAESSR